MSPMLLLARSLVWWLALTLDFTSSHSYMFNNAKEFNQALGSWDVAKVTTTV